jgi:hypothetical protein
MTFANTNLSATFGSNLLPGVYTIGVRAKDTAGNWSSASKTMLVVYDANTTSSMTGKNKKDLTPSTTNGDVLPGLVSGTNVSADYGFTVQYKNGALDSHNDFKFVYDANGHSLSLDANTFDWFTVGGTNNSQGWFQGTATLVVDGVTTTNTFVVTGIDGSKLNPAQSNYLQLKIYAPGASPSAAAPLYQASGYVSSPPAVKIK